MFRCANSILESSKTGFAQQAVEDRVELPLKPKKPNPPFFQFLQEKRSEVMKNKNLRVKGNKVFILNICELHFLIV